MVSFNEIVSLDFGLYIKRAGKTSYNGASRSLDFETVPGRSGDLIIDNKRFQNILISYEFAFLESPTKSFEQRTHDIKKWLMSTPNYCRLWDSYDAYYIRYGVFVDEMQFDEDIRGWGEFTATFNCKPFVYPRSGLETFSFSGSANCSNPCFLASKPYMKIFGNGNITLMVNNNSFLFEDVESYIEIDSEMMNCYKGVVPQNHKMKTPFFPEFVPGMNSISSVGSVSRIEVIPRWCEL